MVQAVATFKNGGVAFILGFFFGLFLFNGIGHMYIGKVRRGVGILLLGWLIYSVILSFMVFAIGLNFAQFYGSYTGQNEMFGTDNSMMSSSGNPNSDFVNYSMLFVIIFAIAYVTFCIVQAADANRLAKKFNRNLDKEGTLLWY